MLFRSQATDHRRIPPTTPVLEDRRAPVRVGVALRPGEPVGVLPDQVTSLSLQGTSIFDPVTNQLMLDVRVVGVDAEDVLGMALRFPQERGGWQVAHLIMRAGEDQALWVGQLSARQREHLDASELHLVVLTRTHPLGAAVFGLQRRR